MFLVTCLLTCFAIDACEYNIYIYRFGSHVNILYMCCMLCIYIFYDTDMSSFGRHLYGFATFCSIRILVISFGLSLRVALQQMSAFIQDAAGYMSKGKKAAS